MKRIRNEPQLLPNVMEAIACMKERAGSTQKQITGHISQWLANTDTSKNMAMKVRRALEYGLQSGLIKHMRGKYSLGLNKRDYATSKRLPDPYSDCNTCRRRGRRGKRGGRRRSRSRRRRSKRRSRHPTRRHMSTEDDVIENIESNMSMMDAVEPVDKSRKRRSRKRRNKRRSRRYGKRRRRSSLDGANSDASDIERKELKEEKKRSEQEKPGYQSEEDGINSETNNS